MASTGSPPNKPTGNAIQASALNTLPAVFACIVYFVAPALYFGTEFYVSQEHSPSYSYKEHYTSQLAVSKEYIDKKTGRLAVSPRGNLMNLMFFSHGLLFLLGQRLLLSSFKASKLVKARTIAAVGYMIGTTLLAAIPAGDKEEEAGLAPFHILGAVLAIGSGNVTALLTGIAAERWSLHKVVPLVSGIIGLVSFVAFIAVGEKGPTPGLYQRASIYPIEVWMFFTADMLMGEISKFMKEMDQEIIKQE